MDYTLPDTSVCGICEAIIEQTQLECDACTHLMNEDSCLSSAIAESVGE